MTLHLTQVSNLYVLQVSDRKVTGGITDPIANKNVIYQARDAFVTMGYTGLAYGLDDTDHNLPSDEWIASQLLGTSIPRGPGGLNPSTFGGVSNGSRLTIGESLQALKHALGIAIAKLPSAHQAYVFELVVAGWLVQSRKRIRPFSAILSKAAGPGNVEIEFPLRHKQPGTNFLLVEAPDGYVMTHERSALAASLRSSRGSREDFAKFAEQKFLKVIRDVSARENAVGPNCMSVYIPPPGYGDIRINFFPAESHFATVRVGNLRLKEPVAYTPWVVGNGSYSAPSVITGSGRHSQTFGPYKIVYPQSPRSTNVVTYMGSQKRLRY